MPKKSAGKTIAMFATGTTALLGLSYLGYKKFVEEPKLIALQNPENSQGGSSSGASSTTQVATLPKPPISEAFPLKLGDKNQYVKQMQAALLNMGGKVAQYIQDSGGADGVFGEGTANAIVEAGYESPFMRYTPGWIKITKTRFDKITHDHLIKQLGNARGAKPIAVSNKQTFMINSTTLEQDKKPKGYPVRANVVLGYFLGEEDGLAQILTKDGQQFFTSREAVNVQ